MGWGTAANTPVFAASGKAAAWAMFRAPAPRPMAGALNWDAVTIQDCIDMHEMKGLGAELDGGHVTGFTSNGGLRIALLYKAGKGVPG